MQPNLSQTERDCLKSLAFEHMQSRGNDIDRAVQGTCEWLLKHQTCMNWATSHHGLLWIKGKPGAGKSTLLKHALSKQRDMPGATDSDLVLCFFFHGRGDTLQRTPLGLFRSLLHQILKQIPGALSDLVDGYQEKCRDHGAPPEAWQWHPEELWHFLKASAPKILETRPIWLFVDALDECGEEDAVQLAIKFKSLLDSVSSTTAQGIHICFSCRHYPIPPDLDGVMNICVEDENGDDVAAYVRQRLSETFVREAPSIAELITSRASGVFMWARLVLERVLRLERQRARWGRIRDEICSIPPDMNSLYLDHIQRMEDKAASLRLIQWLCFAVRPLSLEEIYWALAIDTDCPHKSLQECGSKEDYGTDDDMQRRIVALSCGLAETVTSSSQTSVVQFIHQSVKDFFVDKGLLVLDSSPETVDEAIGRAHFSLSRTCIRYLLMEEIGQSKSINGEDMENQFPFISYAAITWTAHAHQSDIRGVCQDDLLPLFHWPSSDLLAIWVRVLNLVVTNGHDRQPKESSLVQVAARYGISGALSAILQHTSQITTNLNSQDEDGRSPLSWAAEYGHDSIVKLLLDTGLVEIDAPDCCYQTPLAFAAEWGREAVAKLLLDTGKVQINARDSHHHTPLSWASENGHPAVVKLLLDTGQAEVNVEDKYKRTPLSFTAENGHEAVVKLLLAAKDIVTDAKDVAGRTALCYAAYRGHATVVKLLLDSGQAEADVKDNGKRTPLSLAAAGGHGDVVQLLLDRGVDVDPRDEAGRTALLWAAANGFDAMVKFLHSRGAELNPKDKQSRTPLSWSAANGCDAVVALLLDEGVDFESKGPFRQTPLLLAAANGHEGVVALLLNRGAVVNVRESDGRTPLLRAARRGHEAVVRLLLDKNADVDAKDESGETALSVATRHEHQGVVELLQAHAVTSPEPPQ